MQVVDALHHAGTDKRVQGLVACIGRHLHSEGLAELQELRYAVHDFRLHAGYCSYWLLHLRTCHLHTCADCLSFQVYQKAACPGPSSQVFACLLAALLPHNTSVTCMLTCKQMAVSIGCGEVVITHCVIKSGLLAKSAACAQEFEAGFCSHSCLYRFFWRCGVMWHVCLLPCICIQASVCSSGGDMGCDRLAVCHCICSQAV